MPSEGNSVCVRQVKGMPSFSRYWVFSSLAASAYQALVSLVDFWAHMTLQKFFLVSVAWCGIFMKFCLVGQFSTEWIITSLFIFYRDYCVVTWKGNSAWYFISIYSRKSNVEGELDWNKKTVLLIEKKIHSGMYFIFLWIIILPISWKLWQFSNMNLCIKDLLHWDLQKQLPSYCVPELKLCFAFLVAERKKTCCTS